MEEKRDQHTQGDDMAHEINDPFGRDFFMDQPLKLVDPWGILPNGSI